MARYASVGMSRVLWVILFASLTFLLGALTVGAFRAMQSKSWPVTEGLVVAYYNAPNYRYTVNGVRYESSRVSCNEFFSLNQAARRDGDKLLMKYPLNAKVRVHHHPAKPELAVLETEFDRGIFKVIAVIALLCLICAIGFHRGWRFRVGRRISFSP